MKSYILYKSIYSKNKMSLKQELLELSKEVDSRLGVNVYGKIQKSIELSDNISLPYTFSVEALHPGKYKGYVITRDEIIKGANSIFLEYDNFHNYEINKDHNNSRKEKSSVDDLLGKITMADYDVTKDTYILKGEVYDMAAALKIKNELWKYVSLRIVPHNVQIVNGEKYAKDLEFQEMSFVRKPGDNRVRIINKD